MDPRRWRITEELFCRALDRSPADRDGFVAEASGGDCVLADEVRRLLDDLDESGDFLESSALARYPYLDTPPDPDVRGKRIGSYEILHPIGYGGMGAVYLASRADAAYRQQVAIKLIQPGLDFKSVIHRFRNERQILADLHHPNIARLLDGGTTEDGLPYLVMEYIEGRTITEYADSAGLSVADRLELFVTVCEAVHYAHQNLVVHRDLKPSNILVTADGTPKLLDFGIAKILGSGLQTSQTATMMRAMTPDYASPEQVRGDPITTSTDVYSLGTLLYELLSGSHAYNLEGRPPHEVARLIAEVDPETPSARIRRQGSDKSNRKLQSLLTGDLDTIVLMAMHKDPRRRYTSVEQLAGDIRLHLKGLPVVARKDTVAYRARKFAKRHITGVVAAALLILTLLGGAVATGWQARIATRQRAATEVQRDRAEQYLDDVLGLTHSLLFDYYEQIVDLPGSTPVRAALIEDTVEYLDLVGREAGGYPPLQRQLGAAYIRIGDLQGEPYRANTGDTAGALASYRRAIELLEAASADNPADPELQLELSSAYHAMGGLFLRLRDDGDAIEGYRAALAIREPLAAASPSDHQTLRLLADTSLFIGDPLLSSLNFLEALRYYTEAREMWSVIAFANSQDLNARREMGRSYQRLGSLFDTVGNWLAGQSAAALSDEANHQSAEYYRTALQIYDDLAAEDPDNVSFSRAVADAEVDLSRALSQVGGTDEALRLIRDAESRLVELANTDPANIEARFEVLRAKRVVGDILIRADDSAAALREFDSLIGAAQELLALDPSNREYRSYVDGAYSRAARVLEEMGDFQRALDHYRSHFESGAGLQDVVNPVGTIVSAPAAGDVMAMARLMFKMGEREEARRLAIDGLDRAKARVDSPESLGADAINYANYLLNAYPKDLRDPHTALEYFRRVADAKQDRAILALRGLAQTYYLTGDDRAAVDAALKAFALLPPPFNIQDAARIRQYLEASVVRLSMAQ